MINNCEECDASGPKFRCAKCQKVAYCSKECQNKNWSTHKPVCKQLVSQNHTNASDQAMVDIVVVEGDQPHREQIKASEIDASWEDCIVPNMIGLNSTFFKFF